MSASESERFLPDDSHTQLSKRQIDTSSHDKPGCVVAMVTHLNISVSSPLSSATMTGKPTQAGTR